MKKYLTKSDEETRQLAFNIARQSLGKIFALSGDLGAGKTTFSQGFAKGLGIKDKIISPTFVLIKQYEIVRLHKLPKTKKMLYHVDLYRVESENIKGLGIDEILFDSNNFVLIEWAEKIEKILPKETIKINIEIIKDTKRLITIF